MAIFESRRPTSLSCALGVPLAVLFALSSNAALAQVGGTEPPDTPTQPTQSQPTETRIYLTTGTDRASKQKPVDVVAQEQAEFERAQTACAQGDQSACVKLGVAYEFGRGVAQVRPVSGVLYSEACESGFAEGCYRLGKLNRVVSERSERPAATLDFERACRLGSMDGCLELAIARADGYGIERDRADAERLFRLSCERSAQDACRKLAQFLMMTDPEERAISEAVGLFIRECEAGDVASCQNLARLPNADEPPAGLPHPARVLYLGCEAGDAFFCERLGNKAMLGDGIVEDHAYGLAMYDRACSLDERYCQAGEDTRNLPIVTQRCNEGDFAACAQVGQIYFGGKTVYSSDQYAFNFFSYACENGQFDACERAGITANTLYYAGSSQMWGRAQGYLEIGCEQGDSFACRTLADNLNQGETMPQNTPRAYEIYAQLCELGDRGTCAILETASIRQIDVPLALASPVYEPPRTEEEEEEFRRQLLEEQAARRQEQCDTNSAEFRGRIYNDTICDPAQLVVNGYKLKPGQAPWQALLWRPERVRGIPRPLQAHERVLCGGSIIKRGWILTAAHCLRDRGTSIEGRGYRVRLGVHNPREDQGMSFPILSVHVHHRYKPSTNGFGFDIGLIRYDPSGGKQLGPTNAIARIAIDKVPVAERAIPRGMPAYVYGWGLTGYRSGTTTDTLLGAKLQVYPLDECTDSTNYRGAYLNSALCAAGRNGQQACSGDSGGPLIYYGDADGRPRVIGVVSSGFSCGETGKASRYTRVAAALDWINRVIGGR